MNPTDKPSLSVVELQEQLAFFQNRCLVLRAVNSKIAEDDPDNFLGLSDGKLVPLLVAAIQRLEERISTLEAMQ